MAKTMRTMIYSSIVATTDNLNIPTILIKGITMANTTSKSNANFVIKWGHTTKQCPKLKHTSKAEPIAN